MMSHVIPGDLEKAALRGEPSHVWRDGQKRRLQMMIAAAGERLQGRVLVDGCGVGMYVAHLVPVSLHVIGLDIEFPRVRDTQAYTPNVVCGAGEELPFVSNSQDLVINHEVLEHVSDDRAAIAEMVRVLKPGGRLVLCLPNIGHLICRWWILTGRFPYVLNSPTDAMHLRFFTVREARMLCERRGLRVGSVEGSASLWAKDFYPALWRKVRLRRFITWLARSWPELFGRDFVLVATKV